jgi:hypothetical protein
MALVVAPSASGAAQLDTVTAAGSATGAVNFNINAQSGTSGQNPSGTVAFGVPIQTPHGTVVFPVSGPVTCLSVTGPDHGAGTPGAPTTAVMNFQDPTLGLFTLEVVDHGGNGADILGGLPLSPHRAPADCSPLVGGFTSALSGRAVVFDAPVLPTSKAQCKNGGWRNFGAMFKNQGQCVAFVVKQARQKCLTERAKIGLLAFRDEYGLGPHHVRAMRRCVNQASR